jgi:hypothetical protein
MMSAGIATGVAGVVRRAARVRANLGVAWKPPGCAQPQNERQWLRPGGVGGTLRGTLPRFARFPAGGGRRAVSADDEPEFHQRSLERAGWRGQVARERKAGDCLRWRGSTGRGSTGHRDRGWRADRSHAVADSAIAVAAPWKWLARAGRTSRSSQRRLPRHCGEFQGAQGLEGDFVIGRSAILTVAYAAARRSIVGRCVGPTALPKRGTDQSARHTHRRWPSLRSGQPTGRLLKTPSPFRRTHSPWFRVLLRAGMPPAMTPRRSADIATVCGGTGQRSRIFVTGCRAGEPAKGLDQGAPQVPRSCSLSSLTWMAIRAIRPFVTARSIVPTRRP